MLEIFKEPYIALFIIISIGVALSKIRISGITLGSSSIVFAALILGQFGLKVPTSIENLGLILFIFAVGIQTGPGFFESFKTGEARQYLPTVGVMLILMTVFSYLMSKLVGQNNFFAAGIFSGISTSSASFASIMENSQSHEPTLTYSIAYPIALITSIISVRVLIKFLNIDAKKENENYFNEIKRRYPKIIAKFYKVENQNIFTKTLADLKVSSMTGGVVSRIIRKGSENIIPQKDFQLLENDIIKVIGDEDAQNNVSHLIGPEVDERIETSTRESITQVLVTNIEVIGKRLMNLNLDGLWGAEITKIRRAGMDLTPHRNTRLRFGDKVQVSVSDEMKPNLIRMLGGLESSSIDFLPLALSIVIGVLIGQIKFPIAGSNIGPGISGGILFATLFLGRIGKTGPLLWSIAGKTNQFLRELGLMFFLCGVGSRTGEHFFKALSQYGFKIALMSGVSTVLAIICTSFIILKFQKLNKLRFLGALSGSLTCAPSLPSDEEVDNSTVPLTAYSITYPLALLATILLGQILLFL